MADYDTTVEVSLSAEMIERVLRKWQEENPLRSPDSMRPDEFSRRMMIEIKAGTRIVPHA